VTVLGKARGCDIGLVAPDVSNVHCVIIHLADQFHIRDCASRSGTRLNGQAVTEAVLADGDILQVGPFSFQVHLPPARPAPPPNDKEADRCRRLERSRKHLARLALAQRRRLRELRVDPRSGNGAAVLAARQADLDRQAAGLRDQLRDLEQRTRQLDQAARDLACDRETLDQEYAALQSRVQQAELELARRREEAEADIRARWEQLQQQGRQEEERGRADRAQAQAREEACRALEARRQELDRFHQQLQQTERRLHEQEEHFKQSQQQLALEFDILRSDQQARREEKERWDLDQAAAAAQLAQQQEGIVQADPAVREQRAELVRMMTELKQLHAAARTQGNAEVRALRLEIGRLRQRVADLESQTGLSAAKGETRSGQAAELEQLRARGGDD
jgi:hypothetical protein